MVGTNETQPITCWLAIVEIGLLGTRNTQNNINVTSQMHIIQVEGCRCKIKMKMVIVKL